MNSHVANTVSPADVGIAEGKNMYLSRRGQFSCEVGERGNAPVVRVCLEAWDHYRQFHQRMRGACLGDDDVLQTRKLRLCVGDELEHGA